MIKRNNAAELAALTLRPYKASSTGLKFHTSQAFLRAVRGPYGSGKSSMMVIEILSRAFEQTPFHGIRKSRWVILRNTFPELSLTTLKTWTSWVPTSLAPVRESVPMQARLQCSLTDHTQVDLEVIFLSFDHEDDIRKLKSLEVTGAWLNECSELPEECLTSVSARVGRYPAKDEGGCSWHGIVMDTNSMEDSNWYFRIAEIDKPAGYEFFVQPPAIIEVGARDPAASPLSVSATSTYLPNDGTHGLPVAENIENLPGGFQYYMDMVAGKSREWIAVYLLNSYGSTRSGKVVYPEYLDAIHHSPKPLVPSPGLVLYVGWDFGLSVSCVFAQLTVKGQLKILREISGEDIGIQRFLRDYFKPCITQYYPNYSLMMTGDPAGAQRSQSTEQTCFGIFAEEGFPNVTAAATNEFAARRESVVWFLTHLSSEGSAFLMDPSCVMLRKGFLRTYCYRKMRVEAAQQYTLRPDKNQYSHLQDALQYLCMFLRNAGYSYEKQTIRLPGGPGGIGNQELPVTAESNLAWS